MNIELDRVLCRQYPSLLWRRQVSNDDIFHFECGDGWFDIIHATLGVINKHSNLCDSPVLVTQIKEKFGLLRIYCSGGDEYTDAAISIAELISELVCEVCGGVGTVQITLGWSQVRCDIHKVISAENLNFPVQIYNNYSSSLTRTVDSVLGFFGPNPQWALRWIKEPLAALGHKKPYELLGTCEGCSAVGMLIDRLEHGVFT